MIVDEFQDEIEWLSRSRPVADARRLDEIEQRVMRGAKRRARARTVLAGGAVSGVLATGLIFAALIGGGPLNDADDPARARDDCTTVTVPTVLREGTIVGDERGQPKVVQQTRTVPLGVTACR